MAKVITMTNNKGGSAKTTSTTALAHALSLIMAHVGFEKKRVLVVDTDSQAHSTLLLAGRKDFDIDETLMGVLDEYRRTFKANNVRNAIHTSQWSKNVDVLAAHPRMDEIEDSMVGVDGNVFALTRILREVKDDYALVLIDTCPKFSLLTKMALLAADEAMIPLAPQFLDADGLVSIINKVTSIRNQWEREKPTVTGIIVVKMGARINGHEEIRDSIKNHPQLGRMYLGTIPLNAAVEYATADKESVIGYSYRNNMAEKAYMEVAQNIFKRTFSTQRA